MRAAIAQLRSAAWLGWQIDTNWADPFIFIVYAILRPLATGLILAGVWWAAGAHAPSHAMFDAVYIGNAFHNFVTWVVIGLGWAIVEEREDYETLKYVFTSPMGLYTALAGRALVKLAIAALGTVMVLVVGWFALHVTWDWRAVKGWALALTLLLGCVTTVSAALLGALAVSTLVFAALGRWGYVALETHARRLGRLDQTTMF